MLPSIAHYQSQITAYTPQVTTSLGDWRPDSLAAAATDAAPSRMQISAALSSLASLTWPLYAFLAALAANVCLAGLARSRRRVL